MAGYRINRISEDIMREITAILRSVKDPRVTATMLSVVRVEVTNDMSYATVYISSMEGIEAAKKAVKGLVSAQGYIRRELGMALHLRHVPELRFVADDSMEYSINITEKLRRIEGSAESREPTD
ncbi:MAG: 30S ribosome-binding factor RbfA [Oscillospiraceae bacterium]|nr:30S ribosome-binding factor RbfA [Oscillospiraceae bacterium]